MSFKSDNESVKEGDRTEISRLIETTDEVIDANDVEDLIAKAGGFGKIQLIILIAGMIWYQGINFIIYNLAYFELVPYIKCKYPGTDEYVKCKDYKDICEQGKVYDWYVDYTQKESFHNWMTDHNLYCKDSFVIGLFGSVYFVGLAIGGFILKLSDTYGRRNIIIFASFLHIIAIYGVYFSNNYIAYYAFIFISGLGY